ncbi:sterol uptake control protein 2, partial [Colletotrichum tofieldiae]
MSVGNNLYFMATRRKHTKSRTGCQDCKRRKVKCDESYPSCFDCTRLGITCSFLRTSGQRVEVGQPRPTWPTPAGENDQAGTDTTGTDTPGSESNQSPRLRLLGFVSNYASSPASSDVDIWGRGLELMHHYSVETCNTISFRLDMQYVWKVVVPETAYSTPFVMHGILALSAAHKARLLPNERNAYLDIAAYHQASGLAGFRVALQDLSENTWESVFCFSSLLIIYVCCLHEARDSSDGSFSSVHEVLELFSFVRGMKTTLNASGKPLQRSRFAPLAYGVWSVDESDPMY